MSAQISKSLGLNTFENVEDSDDDETQLGDGNHIPFFHVTRDSSNSYVRITINCSILFFSFFHFVIWNYASDNL